MSGLLKNPQETIAFAKLPARRRAEEAPAPSPDPRIASLEEEVAALRRSMEAERLDAGKAIARARDEGREEATRDEAARLRSLEAGIDAALVHWREGISRLDELAGMLAAIAIDKMFGAMPALDDLTRRTIAHHVDRLGAHAVVKVRVSSADFPDEAHLDALIRQSGLSRAVIVVDPDVPSGNCAVSLRLGAIDLDLKRQWRMLRAVLDDEAVS